LPAKIEELENRIAALNEKINAADFYKQPQQNVADAMGHMQAREEELIQAYARWEELDNR
jgi:ATP-binding cassette subfamily F protein uup